MLTDLSPMLEPPFETIQIFPILPQKFLDEIDVLLSQGFERFIMRDTRSSFQNDEIMVSPTSKNILTCTEVMPGESGTKFEGIARGLRGIGKRGPKDVRAQVVLGLTRHERELAWNNQIECVNRQFEVGCCGVNQDGDLIIPVFRKWKEQT
jgi:hypothetical protein